MEKAKAAVSGFISKSGQHDTTVHEHVDPSVKHETVNPYQRDERQIATDREVHQDHYHTTVQPVHDREVLPEQHHHNIIPVEHRTHDNRDTTDTDTKLRMAKAQHKDEHVRTETQHHTQNMPSVTGEHVHHHIHETIQPVVHKETIEPHVMHTTVPVHEVHHNKAQHHAATALPAMSMDEFKHGGGSLTGRDERVDHFKGVPKNLEQSLGSSGSSGLRDSGISTGSGHHGGAATGAGLAGTAGAGAAAHHRRRSSSSSSDEGRRSKGLGAAATGAGLAGATGAAAAHHHGKDHTGSGLTGNQGIGSTSSAGVTGASQRSAMSGTTGASDTPGVHSGGRPTGSSMLDDHKGTGVGTAGAGAGAAGLSNKVPSETRHTTGGGMTGSSNAPGKYGEFSHRSDGNHPSNVTSSTAEDVHKKPSLMDKLNPKKDADGDGKPGFMS